MREYILVLLVAAATTYLLGGLARRFAARIGAVKPIRDRDVHSALIPRLGGLAVLGGVVAAFLVATQLPFLGMLPGTLTTTVFGDQIQTALEDPSKINWWLVSGVLVMFAVMIWYVRRWFARQGRE